MNERKSSDVNSPAIYISSLVRNSFGTGRKEGMNENVPIIPSGLIVPMNDLSIYPMSLMIPSNSPSDFVVKSIIMVASLPGFITR